MLGLIGTLEMSKRALDTNRQGIELTGHNLSNVSNPAYSRQRLKIQTSDTLQSPAGPTGTGAKVVSVEQFRSQLLDGQITTERSLTGRLEAMKKALEFGEINLGQSIDRQASTPEAATAALGVGGQFGLIEGLTDFFNSLQALSSSPHSTADRQVVLLRGQALAEKFISVDGRLGRLRTDLNTSVTEETAQANQLLLEIADLSVSVSASELGGVGGANDLRDRRQAKLEALANLIDFQTSTGDNNTLNLTIGGITFISENEIADSLETFDDGAGGLLIRSESGTDLTLTSGSIQGNIEARDGAVLTLSNDINTLATTLITKVNEIHETGFALDGTSTGEAFFTGNDASDMAVNTVLSQDPRRVQASANGDPGNNQIAFALAELGVQALTELGQLTFVESYNQSVANFGQALANVRSQLQDEQAVTRMLERQRDSLGGVSIDEEVTNLVIFQRAFQASARMITTIDELLQNVINLSR